MNYQYHFITGMLRSGTTLLNDLVDRIDGISSLYQPFQELFIAAKKQFHRDVGFDEPNFPLFHMYRSDAYSVSDFTNYLTNIEIQYCESKRPFIDWFVGLLTETASDEAVSIGSKEVLCEEFVPYLSQRGIRVSMIVRDPRDVLVSMYFGQNSKRYVGNPRPLLFDVRNWRKSAEIFLNMSGNDNVLRLTYESIVFDPMKVLKSIAEFHRAESTDIELASVKNNSSFSGFEGISTASVGRHADELPNAMRRYVEALCNREMIALGYQSPVLGLDEALQTIENYRDEFDINRSEFPANYSSLEENVAFEKRRLKKLTDRNG